MHSLRVVKLEVFRQALCQLEHAAIAFQVDVLVLETAPKPFDEDIVEAAPAPVHADRDALRFQHAGEGVAGVLATLIGVEYVGCAESFQRFLQAVDTETAI